MHDSSFPDSPEDPDRRSARALEALQYEERAGLGFRRRRRGALGNPYVEADRYQVDREPTSGELWAGMLSGIAVVLGGGALFYKPLLLATVAVLFAVAGLMGDGAPSRVARMAFVVVALGFTFGMLGSIFVTEAPVW